MDKSVSPLRERGFRWLLSGAVVSMLGDQFTLVALPWLVLLLSGDPLALGLVVTLMSVPRAGFILFGGALADRYSPKTMQQLSKFLNAGLLALLVALIAAGWLTLPAVYALALLLGLAQALAIPASFSLLPRVVAPDQLQQANAMLMGLRQLTTLAGPVMAGLLMALLAGPRRDLTGPAVAFAIDGATFLLSAWTLARVPVRAAPAGARGPILRAVGAGLDAVWRDRTLRACFTYWSLVALVVGGSMQVVVPVLAERQFGGAGALGLLLGVYGAGTLAGAVLGGVVRVQRFGAALLAVDALSGLALLPLGHAGAVWQAGLVLGTLGVFGGYMQTFVFTWIQRRVAPAMMGRAMSVFMFIFMGLGPMASLLTGWLLQRVSLTMLFTGCGLLLIVLAGLAWLFSSIRTIGFAPQGEAA